MNKNFYQNLCIKDFTNNISDNEKKLLTEWLAESDKNKLEYKKLKNIWESSAPPKIEYELNLEAEWISLQNKISDAIETQVIVSNPISKFFGSLFAPKLRPIWALGTALLIIISSIIFFRNYESSGSLKTISTVNNQRLEVELSDGSMVQLNSDSEIKFYENFDNDKREIKLKGEAFFSVNKDGRPFIITTENAVTKVLGTKFNVWSRDDETRVIVKEGKVSLSDKSQIKNEVLLTKGELSKVKESLPPSIPSKVDDDYLLGWLNGNLVFNNTPLKEIAEELERFYNTKVIVDNNELVGYNLTGSFNNEKIDSVLTKICLALNLNYVENNNIYSITK